MKDVNDLMQAILEMDAAQRRESEKARLERSARLAAPTPPQELPRRATPPHWPRWRPSAARQPRP